MFKAAVRFGVLCYTTFTKSATVFKPWVQLSRLICQPFAVMASINYHGNFKQEVLTQGLRKQDPKDLKNSALLTTVSFVRLTNPLRKILTEMHEHYNFNNSSIAW